MSKANDQPRFRQGIIVVILVAVTGLILYFGFSIGPISQEGNNPFGPGEGPPSIMLIQNNTEYKGQLLGYVWGERSSFEELPEVSISNVTSVSTENIIDIQRGSEIAFTIESEHPESSFESLSVIAYSEKGVLVCS